MLKKALVTGSATGIGRSIALDLASRGFDVAFHYNRSADAAQQAKEAAEAFGVTAISLQADVTKSDQAQALVHTAAEQLGGLSVVVNNVGNFIEKPMSQVSIEEWHYLLDSNLNATFYVTQTALPYFKAAQAGRIVNFACASAQHLTADQLIGAYKVAKTGVILYTKSLALELIKDNITANVVAPGVAENSVGLEETIPIMPAQKPATLKDLSNAVCFFISPEADYITGQVLEVAGGWRL